MTHFADFSPCTYHDGPFDSDNWRCPLLAVGWLEHPHEFPRGGELAQKVRDRIAFLRFASRLMYGEISFRGLHECSWCRSHGVVDLRATLSDSHTNLFIPATDRVFVAPGRIDHYVEQHGYLLPEEFLQALMQCPDPRTGDDETALCAANGGVTSPLAQERSAWCW